MLGAALAPTLLPADVISLSGDLGAGKTVFVQGLGAALGVQQRITSPTFTLLHEYSGRYQILHLDVYRLDSVQEVLDLGFEELLDPGRSCSSNGVKRSGRFFRPATCTSSCGVSKAATTRIARSSSSHMDPSGSASCRRCALRRRRCSTRSRRRTRALLGSWRRTLLGHTTIGPHERKPRLTDARPRYRDLHPSGKRRHRVRTGRGGVCSHRSRRQLQRIPPSCDPVLFRAVPPWLPERRWSCSQPWPRAVHGYASRRGNGKGTVAGVVGSDRGDGEPGPGRV